MTILGRAASSSDGIPGSANRLRQAAVALLLGTLLAVGCNVLNTLMPERAVKGMLGTLPEPAGIVLIDEVTRGTYGSDDRCTGASTYRLYGTELPFQQVLCFYEDSLPSDRWHKVEEGSPPAIWASATNHFALVLSPNVEATFIPSESIDSGQEEFSTLYYLALSYVSNPEYCRGF